MEMRHSGPEIDYEQLAQKRAKDVRKQSPVEKDKHKRRVLFSIGGLLAMGGSFLFGHLQEKEVECFNQEISTSAINPIKSLKECWDAFNTLCNYEPQFPQLTTEEQIRLIRERNASNIKLKNSNDIWTDYKKRADAIVADRKVITEEDVIYEQRRRQEMSIRDSLMHRIGAGEKLSYTELKKLAFLNGNIDAFEITVKKLNRIHHFDILSPMRIDKQIDKANEARTHQYLEAAYTLRESGDLERSKQAFHTSGITLQTNRDENQYHILVDAAVKGKTDIGPMDEFVSIGKAKIERFNKFRNQFNDEAACYKKDHKEEFEAIETFQSNNQSSGYSRTSKYDKCFFDPRKISGKK